MLSASLHELCVGVITLSALFVFSKNTTVQKFGSVCFFF